jgi:ssDNA-specific exonuclease RecJ
LRFHNTLKKGGLFEQRVELEDRDSYFDPQCVAEHAAHIYKHCLAVEEQTMPLANLMDYQKDINSSMREILCDWLIEVHLKFKLLPETLYLTVNLIDRFLSTTSIYRNKLQLVGVTAMLIASKYEEIYPPIVSDFVYITDNAYKREEILEMEEKMLKKL